MRRVVGEGHAGEVTFKLTRERWGTVRGLLGEEHQAEGIISDKNPEEEAGLACLKDVRPGGWSSENKAERSYKDGVGSGRVSVCPGSTGHRGTLDFLLSVMRSH